MTASGPEPRGGVDARHVGLVAWFATRFAIRTGGGLVYLLAALMTGLIVASVFISPVENLVERPEMVERGVTASDLARQALESEQVRDVVKWTTGSDDAQADYLLVANPALLSAIAIVLLLAFPFLTCFGAFNQTSGDVGSRGLRYLLLRTERQNVFLGRFVGTYLFLAANIVGLVAIVALYVGLKLRAYDAVDLTVWGAQVAVALCLVALPYAALCAWISGAIDSPGGALVLCLLLTGFPVLFLSILGRTIAPGVGVPWLQKLLPWGWKWHLLSHDAGTRLLGYGAMVGFAALFLAVGLRAFSRRDL